MSDLSALMHELELVAGALSLSVGTLIGAALLFYFVASARPLAIALAGTVFIALACFIFGEHDGRAAVTAQWNAANAAAAAAATRRDASNAAAASADEAAGGAALTAQQSTDRDQLNALLRADATCHPITADQLR